MKTPNVISRGVPRLMVNEQDEGAPYGTRIKRICDLVFDLMRIVYQADDKIVAESANKNGDRRSKQDIGKYGTVSVKGYLKQQQWLDCRDLASKEEK